ncbi:hypothetical protein DYB32_009435 [Aphanomyces invadans]|uniref:Helicase-associated domain-containing protein n=1 Tax=Aphanomyces invadans TaxID=157072 RepID=A0A3R7A2Y3_9STRA|nr:hypothetical protein DYB32_009435 [Aphanomyces invadans]
MCELQMLRTIRRICAAKTTAAWFSTASAAASTKKRKFTEMVSALHEFHKQHGHFVVPPRYELRLVQQDTSSTTSGTTYPLGQKLQGLIRKLGQLSISERDQLASIAFPIEWQTYYLRHAVLPALATFQRRFGHLRVPQSFIVPPGDTHSDHPWPPPCAGLRLGHRVNYLRQHADELSIDDVAALNALGFVWNARADRLHQFTIPALLIFHSIHGHWHVPAQFIIPSSDPDGVWPAHLRGFALGTAVMSLRSNLDDSVAFAALAAAGIDLTQSKSAFKWSTQVFPAIQAFVELHGHCDIPQAFVVPCDDRSWPQPTWGLPLGHIVRDIRRGHLYAHVVDKPALDAVGFLWSTADKLRFQVHQRVLPALSTFRREFGHAFVPSDFVVPAKEPWPELAHGFALGGWIARRRSDATDLPHEMRFLLDEAGLIWRRYDARFDQVVLPARFRCMPFEPSKLVVRRDINLEFIATADCRRKSALRPVKGANEWEACVLDGVVVS